MEFVSFVAYESQGARLERSNRRWFILCIVLVACLIMTNFGWLMYEVKSRQNETISIEAQQDSDGQGKNIIIGGDYGEADGEGND